MNVDVISISVNAFLSDMLCNHYKELPYSIIKHIAKTVDHNIIPERAIIYSEDVRSVIDWSQIERMKLIRILIRCLDQDIDIIDNVRPQMNKFNYKIKELIYLLERRPRYINYFPIDLNKITISEAAIILAIGDDYLLEKIDLSKYKFNFKESMKIIQGYKYNRDVVEKINYKSLKGYQISEILVNTGFRDLDILEISSLTNIDWINLLQHRPDMIKLCDFNKFMSGDIFYSIKLCCMFETPDLSHLVINRDMNSISPFGWEKLLIEKPEKFLAHCNFSKLDENNWKYILDKHPEFYIYKN